MFKRSVNILNTNSFFLFGARGTGKRTLLRELFPATGNHIWVDLLKPSEGLRYGDSPDSSRELIETHWPEWVVIDEVQKVPKLLDVVHSENEASGTKFALTGSRARKLKRGASNLLAGRTFVYNLFPFTFQELGSAFSLESMLQWCSLKRKKRSCCFLKPMLRPISKKRFFKNS